MPTGYARKLQLEVLVTYLPSTDDGGAGMSPDDVADEFEHVLAEANTVSKYHWNLHKLGVTEIKAQDVIDQ